MADTITLVEYADYINITVDSITNLYRLRKSFTNDIAYADTLYQERGAAITSWDDRSNVPGHIYYYWITEDNRSTIVSGPIAGKLKQYKLIGRGGGARGGKQKRRSWDYDVMCDLCGFKVRRNVLRRGYIGSHVTGVNYLPNAIASENWTYTDRKPFYYDANVWEWWGNFSGNTPPTDYPQNAFVFPQLEKDSDYRTPPGHYRYPGTPLFYVETSWYAPNIGTPSAAWAIAGGYLIIWVYLVTAGAVYMKVTQGGAPVVDSVNISDLATPGWNKLIYEITWTNASDITVHFGYGGAPAVQPLIVFGGAQLTTGDPTIACLPHRSSGLGVYTTGGMMELCPDCYSGLRRRVPWA
jgi:hypothetical protein